MEAHHGRRTSKGSFSERAGYNPELDYDEDLYAPTSKPTQSSARRQNTSAHRVREPQAALHVPKPRNHYAEPDSGSQEEQPSRHRRQQNTKPSMDYAEADMVGSGEPNYRHRRQPTRPTVDIPNNVSAKPFSATPVSPMDRTSQVRRSSLPQRSPLQKLEGKLGDISKEEKRARMEEAEHRARQSGSRGQREQKRHLSDNYNGPEGYSPANASAQRRNMTDPSRRRHHHEDDVVHGAEQDLDMQGRTPSQKKRRSMADDGRMRFSQASEALREHNSNGSNGDSNSPDGYYEDDPVSKNHHHGTRDDYDARRKGSRQIANGQHDDYQDPASIDRSSSKRLQKKNIPAEYPTGQRQRSQIPQAQHQLQSHRMAARAGEPVTTANDDYDIIPPNEVLTHNAHGPTYAIPPQTAASRDARSRVEPDFRSHSGAGAAVPQAQRTNQRVPTHSNSLQIPTRTFEEWRNAGVAKLELEDLAVDDASNRSRDNRRSSRSHASGAYDGTQGDAPGNYQPALYVKCGPLLRYKGLRRERRSRQGDVVVEREIWRGSVMLVTDDQHSSYSAPVLRLFAQPSELLTPPSNTKNLSSEYDDPIAGETKPSRTGQPLYVKPIESIPELVDLSQEEGDEGLFESYRSSSNKSRLKSKDGEKAGKFKEVKGARLHAERGLTFWRFNIEVELGVTQARIAYRINGGPATGFWVPARGSTMNIMFHSCNGFSLSVDPNSFSGPDPLWRDVLNSHAMKPYHVMLGGGDQVYNDRVMRETNLFREWLQIKNPQHKSNAEFTKEMQNELENFYLDRYCLWFSQGLFGMANSQIPMVNLWDDHDIIDGYGSYPDHFMRNKVFTGLGAVAFKYYMLFQHQSVPAETHEDEPSWILGASPGPYIHQHSRNVFMQLGRRVAFLGLDCRTERRRDEVLCQGTYDLVFNRCRAEIIKGETKHLIVMLTVPIAYPRLNFLENILTSKAMDPVKALGRAGMLGLGGFVNKFEGGAEILDDLDDHWTAKHHKQERNWFVQELQALAAEKSVRITILGGDVHLGAIGQFYTTKKLGHVAKDHDHRYMPNVVSSAIVNTPPPNMMADILNKRNKIHHLDDETDEDMIPMFEYDVDGKPRKNKTLLPRRNYCTIREYFPGSTPPHSPVHEEQPALPPRRRSRDDESRRYPPGSMLRSHSPETPEEDSRRYPPGSLPQSRSLTRDSFRPRNLLRRLSGSRSRKEKDEYEHENAYEDAGPRQRRSSLGGPPCGDDNGSYFPEGLTAANTDANANPNAIRPTNMFRRRPTDLSDRQMSKRGLTDREQHDAHEEHPDDINLEYGLDICINMEVSQTDPAGITVPYRLLVPALTYAGPQDINHTRFKTRRASLLDRFRGRGASGQKQQDDYDSYSDSQSDGSRSPSPNQGPPLPNRPSHPGRPLHPDDRLQFADQQHTNAHHDPRRDSRNPRQSLDGTAEAPPPKPARVLRKNVPPQPHAQDQPASHAHAQTAPLPRPGEGPGDDQSIDGGYAPTEELYASPHQQGKKLGFFGSLKRRFSSRRGGGGRRGAEDELSDDPELYSYDSDTGSEVDFTPPARPPNARPHDGAGQGHGHGQGQGQGQGRGPQYRASDELNLRNDGRVGAGQRGEQGQSHGRQRGLSTGERYYAAGNSGGGPPIGQQSSGMGGGRGREADEVSEDFDDGDSLVEQQQKGNRRGSKADRFFGVGPSGDEGRGQFDDGRHFDERFEEKPQRRGSLKFWKR
ncbi:hypothetical protein C1H76_0575 [Elsinoe australis]|uniref:PhoD-like phosphatase domain-containing protein n=1 Tax=Elsinoe australis TaxID=40998 RepID=A0A4U7BB04_9PEZI|nr:hypothetical protein C1H76_0575 [Elsinoe australis]